MSLLQKTSRKINSAVEKLLFVIGGGICLILFAQVVFRYAGASLGWSEEVSRHLLVAITFLGGTVAYKRAGFIGLKGIGRHMGRFCQRIIATVLQLLTLTCFGIIAWFGAAYVFKAWEQTTASLQIPMSIPFAVIPAASLIFIIHALAGIARSGEMGRP